MLKILSCAGILFLLILFAVQPLYAQSNGENFFKEKCGTDFLQKNMHKEPLSDKKTEKAKKENPFKNIRKEARIYILPIVFHVVMKNPHAVTNTQLEEQLRTLNQDWSGINNDTISILPQFKQYLGKGKIQFCLARIDPNGRPTTGIERVQSSITALVQEGDPVKYKSLGGADAWDHKRFINVWVTDKIFPSNVLGYGSYPDLLPEKEDGIVITAASLPGGTFPNDLGRTLTHEMGHYFSLMHPWIPFGCNGSDFPGTEMYDDTPPQSDPTTDCPSGTLPTKCNLPDNNGRNYQVFMDYPDDACMHMFTKGQMLRAESALLTSRSYLTDTKACALPKLIESGVLITPNPAHSTLYIQHLVPPVELQGISIFNSVGQLMYRQQFFRTAPSYFSVDITRFAPGSYSLRLDYADKTINQKFLKL